MRPVSDEARPAAPAAFSETDFWISPAASSPPLVKAPVMPPVSESARRASSLTSEMALPAPFTASLASSPAVKMPNCGQEGEGEGEQGGG